MSTENQVAAARGQWSRFRNGSRRRFVVSRWLHFFGDDVRLSCWERKRPCNFGCASSALSVTEDTGVAVRGAAGGRAGAWRDCMQLRRVPVRHARRYRLALSEPD